MCNNQFALIKKPIIIILLISSISFYSCTSINDFNPIEKQIQTILDEVRKSLREKNEGTLEGWTNEHQPLNEEVMRYIIFCMPKRKDLRGRPVLCKISDSFYNALKDRSPGKIIDKTELKYDVIFKILQKTDEIKIYNKYIKKIIPPNPTFEDLKFIELTYIHMFQVHEIINDRLLNLSQCTGAARLFMYYARKEGLEVRYVYSVDLEHYKKTCPKRGKPEHMPIYFNCEKSRCESKMIETNDLGEIVLHGHQAVAIQSPNSSKWRILNTSSKTIDWATTDTAGHHIYEKNNMNDLVSPSAKIQKIYYRFYKNNKIITSKPHFVTFVGDDRAFNHEQLMYLYTRGDADGKIKCKWQIDE